MKISKSKFRVICISALLALSQQSFAMADPSGLSKKFCSGIQANCQTFEFMGNVAVFADKEIKTNKAKKVLKSIKTSLKHVECRPSLEGKGSFCVMSKYKQPQKIDELCKDNGFS